MKRIAYIEIDTHAEIAQNFIELMQDSVTFEVDYYFSEKINLRIKAHNINKFLTDEKNLLKDIKKLKYDFVILGSAQRYFNTFYDLVNTFPTYIISHNLNFIKASNAILLNNIFKKDVMYRIKLLLKEGLMLKNKVYQGAQKLLVLDENLVEYSRNKRIKYLPIFYSKYEYEAKNNPISHIAIPGEVNQKRKKYRRIFTKIRKFKKHFVFTFLGKATGNEYQELLKLKEQTKDNIVLNFYNQRVPAELFDQKMLESSVLWCPIQERTEFFNVREIYGKTKVSGSVGDAIKYAKPAIFPHTYTSSFSFIFKEEKDVELQFSKIKDEVFDFVNFNKQIVIKELELTLLDFYQNK